jgi:TolA-binding protein
MRLFLATLLLFGGTMIGAGQAVAQSSLPARVDRLESEMTAVQRKVFPGGAGQYVQPQITPGAPAEAPGYGSPASSPVTDLNARVNALEQQMSSMTGQIEESQHRLQLMQDDVAAYKRVTDARLAALEGNAPGAIGGNAGAGPALADAGAPPSRSYPDRAPARPAAPAETASAPSDAGAVAAVERPSTGDPEEDAYIYGYRLWQAKLYPEAETQLKTVVAKYPDTRRASYAQNLLGRSYLDEGKPSLASIAFYDNYKKMPDGERAPDSLYYLAQALMQLKKPADACKVYGELSDVYSGKISASMTADIAQGRQEAQCK